MQEKPTPRPRGAYRWFTTLATRWNDQDAFGHVNNAVYYTFFDTAITLFFRDKAGYNLIDPKVDVVTVAVDTRCTYFKSLTHPTDFEVGVVCGHIGRTSSRYDLGLFLMGDDQPLAQGSLAHVHVTRDSNEPRDIPPVLRAAMEGIRAL